MKTNEKVSIWVLVLNFIIFVGKLFAGLISNSVAIISDSLDSLGDILTSIGIFIAIRTGNKPADTSHPFGHQRAEPLAGFIIALFTGILAFQIITMGFRRLFNPVQTNITLIVLIIVIISMLIKLVMFFSLGVFGKMLNSPAITAASVDSRNDVFRSAVVLAAVISTLLGYLWIESVVSIIIGAVLFYSAYHIGKSNVDMLMGHAPPKKYLDHIKKEARHFHDIKGVGAVRAHYTGNSINLEIVVKMNPRMTVKKSHGVAADLRDKLQEHPEINRVFVHIDPCC